MFLELALDVFSYRSDIDDIIFIFISNNYASFTTSLKKEVIKKSIFNCSSIFVTIVCILLCLSVNLLNIDEHLLSMCIVLSFSRNIDDITGEPGKDLFGESEVEPCTIDSVLEKIELIAEITI